jgi:hypothetical protein
MERRLPGGGRVPICVAGTYEVEELGLEISLSDVFINLADSPYKCIPASDARCTEVVTRGSEESRDDPEEPDVEPSS